MRSDKVFAIIGGIGSGKSSLSNILGRDFLVQDADKVAKEVLAGKQRELIARYGPEIVESTDADVSINRKRLSEILFQSDEKAASRERQWIADLVNEDVVRLIFERATGHKLSFAEITAPTSALLREFDGLIVVRVDEDTAIARTDHRENGWSSERRRQVFRLQMARIDRCVKDYVDAGAVVAAFPVQGSKNSETAKDSSINPAKCERLVVRVDNTKNEEALVQTAKQVILAIGGCEQVYDE